MSFRSRRPDSYRQQPGFRNLQLESLEARLPLAADFHLLSDVNQTLEAISSNISSAVTIGGTTYFSANDGVSGRELWKSDGTTAGTVRVKDIYPGGKGSDPQDLTEFQGILYFAAHDRDNGADYYGNRDVELWRSDGTEAGTYRLKELVPGIGPSNLGQPVNVEGTLFFAARYSPGSDIRLWKSDGTESGTEVVTIPNVFYQPTFPSVIGSAGNALLFTSNGDLWRSDGTGAGTFQLKDFSSPSYTEWPRVLSQTAEMTYFTVNDGSGFGLWRTDGTVAGTFFIKTIQPSGPNPGFLSAANLGNTIIFGASDAEHGAELWKSDGTPEGTVLVKDLWPGNSSYMPPWDPTPFPNSSSPAGFTNLNGQIYFLATGNVDMGLWRTDGTSAGTLLVKTITGLAGNPRYSTLENVGGTLYFSTTFNSSSEPWVSDGTAAGTMRLKDINAGNRGSFAGSFTELDGQAIFLASDGIHGEELWRSDGTEAGTTLVKDILPATAGSEPSMVTNVAGAIYFKANDGLAGEELWMSGGDAATTRLVKDIRPGGAGAEIEHLVDVNGTLFFTANDGFSGIELWRSDGTAAGTTLVRDIAVGPSGSTPRSLANVGGKLYFAANDGAAGVELWTSDGTEAGTVRVKDLAAGAAGSSADNLVNVDGVLYFSADDGISGHELWKSDGTELGTALVKDIFPGISGSIALQLINVGGVLYFSAKDSETNGELWKSDGTAAGTVQVKDLESGPNGSWPQWLTNINGELYFSTNNHTPNAGLWKSNGTEAGTVRIPNFSAHQSSLSLRVVGQVGTTLFVVESSWSDGSTLWSTDGTDAGTRSLTGSDPLGNFIMWGDHLYFTRTDNVHGNELWRSDGTHAGTELVKDFSNDSRSSMSGWDLLKVVNDRLVVITTTDRYGAELWISATPIEPLPGDYDANGVVDGADFLAWHRGFGGAAAPAGSGADGDGSGAVDAGDLPVWAEHFGEGSASGAAAGLAAGVMAVEMAESELVSPVSLAAAEGVVLGEGVVAKPQAVSGRDSTAAGDLAGLAQREASGREALGGRAWDRAAARLEEVAEASSRRRAVAASLDAAFASLGTSSRRERWGRGIDADEIDDAAAGFNKVAKPRAGGVASIGGWGESGEGAPGR